MDKLGLDGFQIGENIGMIKFQIIQNQSAGMVVQKLAALVEKSGVIFIAFQHEFGTIAQSGTAAKIFRHAANQKTGRLFCRFQHMRQQ